ncbi:hypothetical protein Tco_0821793 [Tanacetum coccineum]|uniref:Uncharacterized protein n=1 Tax=Tanacetum coccineum TaxID=301880 RepID=A0ABQ5AI27_9ASTR
MGKTIEDNDKSSTFKIAKHEGTSLQRRRRPIPKELNDKSNLTDLRGVSSMNLTSGEYWFSLYFIKSIKEARSRVQEPHFGGDC